MKPGSTIEMDERLRQIRRNNLRAAHNKLAREGKNATIKIRNEYREFYESLAPENSHPRQRFGLGVIEGCKLLSEIKKQGLSLSEVKEIFAAANKQEINLKELLGID